MQAFGFRSTQYEQAIDLAIVIHKAVDGNVIFTGHSLGGGLACAASYATGADAVTFNSAGLSGRYASGTPGNIRAHFVVGDPLSLTQAILPIPAASGTRISHGGRSWLSGPRGRHSSMGFNSGYY